MHEQPLYINSRMTHRYDAVAKCVQVYEVHPRGLEGTGAIHSHHHVAAMQISMAWLGESFRKRVVVHAAHLSANRLRDNCYCATGVHGSHRKMVP
eukprot:CAMPEP_0114281804 /NCGR_PEP_ID=MMETSP0059-20121206/3211_1 /TAXON_ID=36894 /ORGANISM="Pyramimonas parkeae, Strain CCMP726" /LENGTH=94 /DNA_ID=CAMNT_0001402385 /DNA_START=770 /DNA_END=1054 /DNA_ORIENTATION=+